MCVDPFPPRRHRLLRGTHAPNQILLTSGAHLSRYLIQVAMHHYFRTSTHFIKSNWVRSVSFPVFAYFLKLAADVYGEIPCAKGEDDGSMFSTFLKESRFPTGMKSVAWEEIRDIMEKYQVCARIRHCRLMCLFSHLSSFHFAIEYASILV